MVFAIVILYIWNILFLLHYTKQLNTIAYNFMAIKKVIIKNLQQERER